MMNSKEFELMKRTHNVRVGMNYLPQYWGRLMIKSECMDAEVKEDE